MFVWGRGKMVVDDKTYAVQEGDIVLIPDGAFHKVWNQDDLLDMEFICVFDGGRNHESNG